MLRYQFASTVGTLLNLTGTVLLIQVVSRQVSVGSGSAENLVAGVAALVIGIVFCLLGDIGRRLQRLEEKAGLSPEVENVPKGTR